MEEPKRLVLAAPLPGIAADLEQPTRAVHVGFDKRLGVVNGAVHVGFGRKVNHAGKILFPKDRRQQLFVQNAAVNETVAVGIARGKIFQVGRRYCRGERKAFVANWIRIVGLELLFRMQDDAVS